MMSRYWRCTVSALVLLIACTINVNGQDGSTLEQIQDELNTIQTTLDRLENLVIPTTTAAGTTMGTAESTVQPSTPSGTSEGTAVPTTPQETTDEPVTPNPTTAEPTTPKPTTAEPTTPKPTTAEPTTPKPTTAEPTTPKPTTAEATTQNSSGRLLHYRGRQVLSLREEVTGSTQSSSDSASTSTSPSSSSSDPTPPLCTKNETAGEDDLCTRFIQVLDDIEEVTKEIENGLAGEEQLETLKNCSARLDQVVQEAETDPEFLESINKEQFEERKSDVDKSIDNAEKVVEEKLNPEDPYDPTVAIVLGVLGGLVVVALAGYGGYVYYKKKKEPKDGKGYDNVTYDSGNEAGSS